MKTLFIALLCLALMPESIISSKEATLTKTAFVESFDKKISSADLFRLMQTVGPNLFEGFHEGLVEGVVKGLNESFDMEINSTDLGRMMLSVGPKLVEDFFEGFVEGWNEMFDMEITRTDFARIMLSVGPKLVESFVQSFVEGWNEEFVLGESFDKEMSEDDLRSEKKSLGSKPSDTTDLEKVSEKSDADGDGRISYGELNRILSSEEMAPRRRSKFPPHALYNGYDGYRSISKEEDPANQNKWVWQRDTPDEEPASILKLRALLSKKPQAAVEKEHGDGFGDR